VAPDGVFTSPPCKGLSGLLPSASAASEKYQALNELTVRGVRLVLEAFPEAPPKVILFENVPRIKTRGRHLLAEITALLRRHGYAVDQRDHDCGELGGLGQRRKRFLLIARHQKSLRPFIYQPEAKPLQTIGDVIGPLPLPDAPELGPLHRLPRLKWLTWLRLALIPAGGDWRDLQKVAPEEYRLVHEPRGGGSWGVQEWDAPGASVTGSASVKGSNAASVADPRSGYFQVAPWAEPSGTVTAAARLSRSNGVAAIADPRMPVKGDSYNGSPGLYGVSRWDEAAPAVTGSAKVSSSNCPSAIADPRLKHSPYPGVYGVLRTDEASPAVTGGQGVGVSNGPQAIADPRLPASRGVYPNRFRLVRWDGPAPTVTGDTDVQCGAPSIDDPRLGCSPRGNTRGPFGVQPWNETSSTERLSDHLRRLRPCGGVGRVAPDAGGRRVAARGDPVPGLSAGGGAAGDGGDAP
jgi:site-specific DNA-cytosine methylase